MLPYWNYKSTYKHTPLTPPEPRKVRGDGSPIKVKKYYTTQLMYCFIAMSIITLALFFFTEIKESIFSFSLFVVSCLVTIAVMIALTAEVMKETLKL